MAGDVLACRDHILGRLTEAMDDRGPGLSWIERERFVVATAANEWTFSHGGGRTVTVADVERLEVLAVGHVDYASKLALYVAEAALRGEERHG